MESLRGAIGDALARGYDPEGMQAALENVTLTIAEREGVADDLLRPAGRHRRVIEEAFALLGSLGLAGDAVAPVTRDALRSALMPTINSMAATAWRLCPAW
jgi:hypothetical protein